MCCRDGAGARLKQRPSCAEMSACQHLPGGEAPPWEHLPRWEAGTGPGRRAGVQWGTYVGEELEGRRGARAVTLVGQ